MCQFMQTRPNPVSPLAQRRARRVWLALPILALLFALHAHAEGTLEDLDRDNGLPDAQLGANVRNFQGLRKTEDTGRFTTFTRPGEKMVFEGAEITGITYNFFKDELYSIDIDVAGVTNVKKVLRYLETHYGNDHTKETRTYAKTAAELDIREWVGRKAYCLLKSGTDLKGAVLVFVNRPKWDELEVPRKEREKQSRDMLKGSFTNGDF